METQDRNIANGAMHAGIPYGSYIKTILGKMFVSVWDSFENRAEGIILQGDPRKKEENSIVDVWSQEEDYYFRSKNKRLLETGQIIAYTRKDEERERTIEEYSDDELTVIINSKFFTLQNVLNNTSSTAVLFRIKNLAQELEKSDKLIKAIEARISEVQAEEFKPLPKVVTVEL